MALFSTKHIIVKEKAPFPSRPVRPGATEHKGLMLPCYATGLNTALYAK